jgi:hypothetical protein
MGWFHGRACFRPVEKTCVLVFSAGLLVGCSSFPTVRTPVSRPAPSRAAVASEAEIEVVEVRTGPKRARPEARDLGFTLELRLRLRAGEAVARGFVTPAAHAPCQASVADGGLWIDDQLAVARPQTIAASSRVELEFPHRETVVALRDGSAVDLEIRGEGGEVRCARAPLARDPDFVLQPKPTFSFGGKLRVHVPLTSIHHTSSSTTLGLAIGRWAGPVYVDLSAGLGLGFCRDCAENQSGFFGMPLGLEARDYLLLGKGYALGLGLGYTGMPAFFPGNAVWIHAPRASLSFASAAPAPSGFPSNVRSEAFGVELFGERWIFRLSGQNEQATTVGIGLFFNGAM